MKMSRRKILLVGLALSAVVGAAGYWKRQSIFAAYRDYRLQQVTKALSKCDKVEVCYLGRNDFGVDGPATTPQQFPMGDRHAPIVRSVRLIGEEAEEFAQVWRSQVFGSEFSAMCHYPAYGIRFYSNETLLFETTVCFQCTNFQYELFGESAWQGFDVIRPQAAQWLLLLQHHFPESEPSDDELKRLPLYFRKLKEIRAGTLTK